MTLIVTALLDGKSQEMFDDLRRLHFPPERNYLNAHVTLFHAIPAEHEELVSRDIEQCAPHTSIVVSVSKVVLLGNGVAFRLESPALMEMRNQLAELWKSWLTTQDRQKRELHVTVQNKVSSQVARDLHDQLDSKFEPFRAQCEGIGLWRYMGGPWSPIEKYTFIRP